MEKFQITNKGYEKLKQELDRLKNSERPSIIKQIASARELGDLRENAEYQTAKDRQGFIEAQISDLEDKFLRAEIVDISLPHTEYAAAVYYVLAPAECSSNLARFDGVRYGFRTSQQNISIQELYQKSRAEGFGKEVKKRIMIGTYVLSAGYYDAYYKKAQKVRRLIYNDFAEAFKKVDAILTPSTPNAAFGFDEMKSFDAIRIYLNDVFTVPANLAGLPAISVPAGFDKTNLPLGLQIISKHFDEQTLFNVAKAIEESNSKQ